MVVEEPVAKIKLINWKFTYCLDLLLYFYYQIVVYYHEQSSIFLFTDELVANFQAPIDV